MFRNQQYRITLRVRSNYSVLIMVYGGIEIDEEKGVKALFSDLLLGL
jgi:hypothetical protein